MTMNLGRKPSPLDIRDYKLGSFMPKRYNIAGSKSWPFLSDPLYQGETNHCVGFSMANWGINLPVQDTYTNEDGHNFYYKCKVVDGEPKDEGGSYIRSAAKVFREMGKISSYAFANSVDEITYWILNNGPVIVGTEWTEGMFRPGARNIILPTGNVVGGHAYLLNEKTDDNLYGIQNSWDGYWGVNGKAYISIDDFAILFRSGGEAIAAVDAPTSTIQPSTKDGCLTSIINFLQPYFYK